MSATWFITGASRGLGRELTVQVLARGDRVAATLRHPEQLNNLVAVYGDHLWVRQLDVTDTMEMSRVVKRHSQITSGLMWLFPMLALGSSARQRI